MSSVSRLSLPLLTPYEQSDYKYPAPTPDYKYPEPNASINQGSGNHTHAGTVLSNPKPTSATSGFQEVIVIRGGSAFPEEAWQRTFHPRESQTDLEPERVTCQPNTACTCIGLLVITGVAEAAFGLYVKKALEASNEFNHEFTVIMQQNTTAAVIAAKDLVQQYFSDQIYFNLRINSSSNMMILSAVGMVIYTTYAFKKIEKEGEARLCAARVSLAIIGAGAIVVGAGAIAATTVGWLAIGTGAITVITSSLPVKKVYDISQKANEGLEYVSNKVANCFRYFCRRQ